LSRAEKRKRLCRVTCCFGEAQGGLLYRIVKKPKQKKNNRKKKEEHQKPRGVSGYLKSKGIALNVKGGFRFSFRA